MPRRELDELAVQARGAGGQGLAWLPGPLDKFLSDAEVKKFLEKPYVYQNQFEIGSGQYKLKVVFTSGNNSFGKLETPLVVDSYDAKQFSMSAVALSKDVVGRGATADAIAKPSYERVERERGKHGREHFGKKIKPLDDRRCDALCERARLYYGMRGRGRGHRCFTRLSVFT